MKLYVSQAALKNSRDCRDGVDTEITSLQAEVEVNITFNFFHILKTGCYLCFTYFLSNRMPKLRLRLQ